MDKLECKKIYEEYKEIRSRMDESTRLTSSGEQVINPEFPIGEVGRLTELARTLKNNCKDCLETTEKELLQIRIDSTAK